MLRIRFTIYWKSVTENYISRYDRMLARASCHVDYKKFYMTCQEYEIILVEDTPPPKMTAYDTVSCIMYYKKEKWTYNFTTTIFWINNKEF